MSGHVIEPVTTDLPRLRMTYQEFLDWSDDTTHAEWVDGEVIVFMPPMELHQLVEGFSFSLLDIFVRMYNLGAVLQSPFEMKLPDGSSREPDLLFLVREHFDRRTAVRLIGPADLVLEILSDSTARYDRYVKFFAYQDAGVPEYWLVDPRPGKQRIEVFALSADGQYRPVDPDAQGRFHSLVLPGFWFDPKWLRHVPLPDPEDAILEIAPDAYFEWIRAKYEAQRSSGNGSRSHR
jgi:Uma2 family endonuclease